MASSGPWSNSASVQDHMNMSQVQQQPLQNRARMQLMAQEINFYYNSHYNNQCNPMVDSDYK